MVLRVSFCEYPSTDGLKPFNMKNRILPVLGLFIFSLSICAQEINTVPSSGIAKLPDGWHKFQSQGAFLDVEIISGNLTQGNIKWFDNATYSGNFSGFFIAGKGTYTWPGGKRYEGSFKDNERHGKGSMIEADGSKWSGKWKNNKKNGKGKAFDAQGNLIKEGIWKDDIFIGAKKKKKKG